MEIININSCQPEAFKIALKAMCDLSATMTTVASEISTTAPYDFRVNPERLSLEQLKKFCEILEPPPKTFYLGRQKEKWSRGKMKNLAPWERK